MNAAATTTIEQPQKRFLTAGWRDLLMLNYPVDPAVVQPYLPRGTEIDFWNGHTYVSLVGFLFLDTKVLGIPIPLHRNFEELNLRFYVRRKASDGWRRGVVFIKEIVPRYMISQVARTVYNENYVTMPMRHAKTDPTANQTGHLRYEWYGHGQWYQLAADFAGEPQPLTTGSEAEFITEHYWGYTRQRDGGTMEYKVEHPPWRVWPTTSARLVGDIAPLYGPEFVPTLSAAPSSAFIAEGSGIVVRKGTRFRD
jgi:uncharacterized protein YqjF (DUF2071 family)